MKQTQQGMGLIILMISIAIIAIIAGVYFTRGEDGEKSQYEQGQDGIEQAKEIKTKSEEQSKQIKTELDIYSDLNAQ